MLIINFPSFSKTFGDSSGGDRSCGGNTLEQNLMEILVRDLKWKKNHIDMN